MSDVLVTFDFVLTWVILGYALSFFLYAFLKYFFRQSLGALLFGLIAGSVGIVAFAMSFYDTQRKNSYIVMMIETSTCFVLFSIFFWCTQFQFKEKTVEVKEDEQREKLVDDDENGKGKSKVIITETPVKKFWPYGAWAVFNFLLGIVFVVGYIYATMNK